MAERQLIDIQASTVFKVIFIILGFVFLYLLKDVLMVLFFAIVVASAVGPFASWLEVRRIPRLLGVLILYLVFFGLIIFLLSLVVPFFSIEVSNLTQALPQFFTKISGALDKVQQTSNNSYFDFLSEIQNLLDSFSQFLQVSSQSAINFIIGIFGGVLSFVSVVVISFYLSVTPRGITSFIRSVMPTKYEDYLIDLWHRSERKVGRWMQGQLLLALSVGLVVFIGLSLFHIKYALLLAILAMFLEVIPIAGPVISAVPGVALAFLQSPAIGIWVLAFYVVVQQLESHLLAPYILGKTLGLNPITVILALLVGGKLAGILGIILSVPVAVVIVEVLDDLARHKESRRVARSS